MAFGGGTFTVMNKVLPGTYINFNTTGVGAIDTTVEGVVAMPLELDWGASDTVMQITRSEALTNAVKLFGYDYTHEKLKGIREVFRHAATLIAYRVNGGGVKAANTYATAKYTGTRGNDITIIIKTNVDDETKFDVQTAFAGNVIDTQTVATAAALVNNDFVDFKTDATLAVTAGTPMTGGSNVSPTGAQYSAFLDAISTYQFNIVACATTDEATKAMIASFTEEMRENVGIKFQAVLYSHAADYEGVINVKNTVTDVGANAASLVYWVAGLCASKAVNESAMNDVYNGEFSVDTSFTQAQLSAARANGEFTLHLVGDEVRVLYDINSLTSISDTKGDVFKENQTIRVIDYIGNAIASIFNSSYIGTVPNDEAGRSALWTDIYTLNQGLANIRAIDEFDEDSLTVSEGNTKRAVIVTETITLVGTMEQLYMTVTVE